MGVEVTKMKKVSLFLDDEQHEQLVRRKDELGLTWVDFVMKLVE